MIGCHIGRIFQVTVAGGSYQDGLTSVIQGHKPGMLLSEQEIYGDLLLRKPGADELSSPRKEPDLPIIYSGLNAADTVEGAGKDLPVAGRDHHGPHLVAFQAAGRPGPVSAAVRAAMEALLRGGIEARWRGGIDGQLLDSGIGQP